MGDLWSAIEAATTQWTPASGTALGRIRCHGRRSSRRVHSRAGTLHRLTHRLGTRLPDVPIVGLLEGGYRSQRIAEGAWRICAPFSNPACCRFRPSHIIHRTHFRPAPFEDRSCPIHCGWMSSSSSFAPSTRSSSLAGVRATIAPCGSVSPTGTGRKAGVRRRPASSMARPPSQWWPRCEVYGRIAAGRSVQPGGCGAALGNEAAGQRGRPRGALCRAARSGGQAAAGSRSTGCGGWIPARPRSPLSPSVSIRRSGSRPRCGRRSSIPILKVKLGTDRDRGDSASHPRGHRQGAPGGRQLRLDREARHPDAAGARGIRGHSPGAAAAARRPRWSGRHHRAGRDPGDRRRELPDRRRIFRRWWERWTASTSSWPSAADCGRRFG